MKCSITALTAMLLCGIAANGELVHVKWQTLAGTTVNEYDSEVVSTGSIYTTVEPPVIDGYLFTEWSIDTGQEIENRDVYGRSFDVVSAIIYEDTVFIANYIAKSIDSDSDGIPDAKEIYWYGNTLHGADDDTDGDGMSFFEELRCGTNIHLANKSIKGLVYENSAAVVYNPHSYPKVLKRCEPEGILFQTETDYVKPGCVYTSDSCNVKTSRFAYWILDGLRQTDSIGRSLDTVSFQMPEHDVELVAVCELDDFVRYYMHWYGSEELDMASDSDCDGRTFAEEIAAGTNPLLKDRTVLRGVMFADSKETDYNPNSYPKLIIECDPEGVLFSTVTTRYLSPGSEYASPHCKYTDGFMYWSMNGIRQKDVLGRACDEVAFKMPDHDLTLIAYSTGDPEEQMQMYWYGSENYDLQSDTDGDGFSLEEEVAAGTSPLVYDRVLAKGVVYGHAMAQEVNLQPYEQVQGAVVDEKFKEIFTSQAVGNETTSETFGEDLQPIVWDLNGDGLFDLVLSYKGGYKTFINVGYSGNPEFEERKDIAMGGVDFEMNGIEKLYSLSLDVEPVDELSATTNGTALLVSDTYGRIWYYENFVLQHKVWGGSHAGFAQGLRLAAVDWDDDGDLDCLAGTADGKLMLLRDPRVGRPTNVKAFAGVDNILLTWDPNQQSRIRGYRVYRGNGELGTGNGGDFTRIAQTQLPTYRDFPGSGDEFTYKVSSVSRFYTAGNSTPTETESPATEAVTARLGSVRFFWNDAATKVGEQFEVMLSIENSMNYSVTGQTEVVVYDSEYLTPVKVVKTGLTEECVIEESHHEQTGVSPVGEWRITVGGGHAGRVTLPAGGGKFLSLVFEAKKEGVTTVGGCGATALPMGDGSCATVSIAARAASAPYQLGDLDGDGNLDVEDLRLLVKLKNGSGRKWNADQLKAGDFNGNGKLDNADYQALRALLKEKGTL